MDDNGGTGLKRCECTSMMNLIMSFLIQMENSALRSLTLLPSMTQTVKRKLACLVLDISFVGMFISITINHQAISSKNTLCFRSTYQDEGQSENDFIEQCEVHGDFDDYDFQPTPDGVYIFSLQDPTHQVNLNMLEKMIVEMDGSWIPFEKRKVQKLY